MDELSGKADSIVSDDQPISAEQALAVNAAGLDPDKSLNEQLRGDRRGDLEQQAAALSEQVQGAF